MSSTAYGDQFFDRIRAQSSPSATAVASWLVRSARPTSVLDVGCGEGAWLAEFIAAGVADAIGLDGDYVDVRRLLVPRERFVAHDLSTPFDLRRRFDLTICLEVAEHLDAAYADGLLASLAAHADTLLFSAAVPHQQGTDHRNEQWPQYWIERLRAIGFDLFDVVRPAFWADDRVAAWYRQNAMIFVRGTEGYAGRLRAAIERLPSFYGSAVVHPGVWEQLNGLMETRIGRSAGPSALLSRLPAATATSIRKRLNPRPAS